MGIMIEANLAKKIGLASHQNATPLIGSIAIANDSEEELENLTLLLIPSLPFANKKNMDNRPNSKGLQDTYQRPRYRPQGRLPGRAF